MQPDIQALLNTIFTNGLALLAFVIAFYGLVAREKKTPYMVNSVYAIILAVVTILLFSVLAKLILPYSLLWSARLVFVSFTLLVLALIYIVLQIARENNRHIFFRDDFWLVSPIWAYCLDRFRTKSRYEHNPMQFSAGLIESLKQCTFLPQEQLEKALEHYRAFKADVSISVVVELPSLPEIDIFNTDLACRFLENECFVQYTSCNRHPVEFLFQLKNKWESSGKDWKTCSNRVILVDGYTPHFGFSDSIYYKWTNKAKAECLNCLKSQPSYAGIHTAIARAFNQIKDESKKISSGDSEVRRPALVIYEGCQALVDLESSEQYRLFVRHVLPSERLWGGMFTVFVEPSIADDNLAVLKSSANIFKSSVPSHNLPGNL
jgi:hypothetical protein